MKINSLFHQKLTIGNMIFVFTLLFATATTANEIKISYQAKKDILSVQVENFSQVEIVQQVAKEMNYSLLDLHVLQEKKRYSFDVTGQTNKILNQMLSPSSVVIVQYGDKQKNSLGVNGYIQVLPYGEEQDRDNLLREGEIKPLKQKNKFRSSNMSKEDWREFKKLEKEMGLGVAEAYWLKYRGIEENNE